MGTWITQTTVDGAPEDVLAVLTDPQACTRWPIEIDVDYRVTPLDERSRVQARVDVKPRGGLTGRLLSKATDALLAGGMLDRALEKIALEVA